MAASWRRGPVGLEEERVLPGDDVLAIGARTPSRGSIQPPSQWGPLGIENPGFPALSQGEADAEDDGSMLTLGSLGDYLAALGKPRAPEAVQDRVRTAAAFFERKFTGRSFEQLVGYLQGVDFSREVVVQKLSQAAGDKMVLVQWQTPAREGGRRPAIVVPGKGAFALGNFFARWGHAAQSLGISQGERQGHRFRVKNGGVDVLVSRTTAVIDDHTPGRTLHARLRPPAATKGSTGNAAQMAEYMGEMVGGGGLQIVIPDPVELFVERV